MWTSGVNTKDVQFSKGTPSILFAKEPIQPLPLSEDQLDVNLLLCLAIDRLSLSIIKHYLSGVRHLHVAEKWPDPNFYCMARLEQVLRGFKSVQAKSKADCEPKTPNLSRS